MHADAPSPVTLSTAHALSGLGEPRSRESVTWVFPCGCAGRRRALRVDLVRRCNGHRRRPPR